MHSEESADLMNLLARTPIFRGGDEVQLQAVRKAARNVQIGRGEFFFHQGEPAVAFYVVVEGQARLSQLTPEGHQVIIRFLRPGDVMGIIVVLSDSAYPLSAEAVTDCKALKWDQDAAVQLMEEHPRLALNGLRMVSGRFHELQDRYRELATERVERRVARALLRLARQTGKRSEEGVLLDIPLSRQDLGQITGTTQYTVSRILSGWEQRGLIATGRERIVIRDPHGLVTIAEDLPDGDEADE